MLRYAVMAVGALALGTSSCALAQETGWTISPSDKADRVQLQLERSRPGHTNSNSFGIAPDSLQGLDMRTDGAVHFTLRREAGRLDCDGVMRARRGTGTCRFAADPAFADALVRHGIARPDEDQSFMLTALDAHIATVDALGHFGYPRPTLDQVLALTIHGASADWLQGLASAGQRGITIDDLIAYRIHGVTAAWLHGLTAADRALGNERGGAVIAMRIHGVSPAWVQGLADAGYRDLPAGDLINMRIHGVTPEFARAAAAMGGRPSAGELVTRRIMGRH
ncbi:hypothetical protein SPAN111604_14525 [Sphingomonas antarctica]|uniref:hypothetical protein n=1 Tax=Sphingomonas antarctica TaxID=2040274 RepID=UPI0039E73EE5